MIDLFFGALFLDKPTRVCLQITSSLHHGEAIAGIKYKRMYSRIGTQPCPYPIPTRSLDVFLNWPMSSGWLNHQPSKGRTGVCQTFR